MLQSYYHEEYGGENDKSIEHTKKEINYLIQIDKIFTLKNLSGELLSFCSIINPDIGILFTKKTFRRKGYGKIILSFCSNQLLKENEEVYIMTDKNHLYSNKACTSLGFSPLFKYASKRIKSS